MRSPKSHRDLNVYKFAMAALADLITVSNSFPDDEKWELRNQIRCSSRSVCSCIAEAWRKRSYPAAFASKLTEAESEAAETQFWIEVALLHGYVSKATCEKIIAQYESILGQLVMLRVSGLKWKRE